MTYDRKKSSFVTFMTNGSCNTEYKVSIVYWWKLFENREAESYYYPIQYSKDVTARDLPLSFVCQQSTLCGVNG